MFFQFTRNLSNPNLNSLTSSALGGALEIIVSFLQFYPSGREKRDAIGRTCLFFEGKSSLLTPTEFSRGSGKTFSPDGHRKSRTPFGIAIPSELIELKNEIGEGGSDAVAQVQRDYACLHSSDEASSQILIWLLFPSRTAVNTMLPSVFCHPKNIILSDIAHCHQRASHKRVRCRLRRIVLLGTSDGPDVHRTPCGGGP